jgi:hypothetical protein
MMSRAQSLGLIKFRQITGLNHVQGFGSCTRLSDDGRYGAAISGEETVIRYD